MEFDYTLLIYGIAAGLMAGAAAGVLAGLAGVGGGLIYVPLFFMMMPGGESSALSLEVLGSLVAVFFTGVFSTRAHWRLGHLHKPSFQRLLPGLLIGAGFGLWSTLQIPAVVILLLLAALDAWIAWDYGRMPAASGRDLPLVPFSIPIGYLSGALGVGGGTMLVPLLRRMLPLREAVGTSAACGMAMAGGAVLLNAVFEARWRELVLDQWLFLVGAWAGILLILPHTSGWAAGLHARLGEERLRLLLKVVFALLAALLALAALRSAALL